MFIINQIKVQLGVRGSATSLDTVRLIKKTIPEIGIGPIIESVKLATPHHIKIIDKKSYLLHLMNEVEYRLTTPNRKLSYFMTSPYEMAIAKMMVKDIHYTDGVKVKQYVLEQLIDVIGYESKVIDRNLYYEFLDIIKFAPFRQVATLTDELKDAILDKIDQQARDTIALGIKDLYFTSLNEAQEIIDLSLMFKKNVDKEQKIN